MTINGTLFVQAINFFIAYMLLRWLFFKPAFAHIHNEERVHEQLRGALAQQRDHIAQRKQFLSEIWQQCQLFFYSKHTTA